MELLWSRGPISTLLYFQKNEKTHLFITYIGILVILACIKDLAYIQDPACIWHLAFTTSCHDPPACMWDLEFIWTRSFMVSWIHYHHIVVCGVDRKWNRDLIFQTGGLFSLQDKPTDNVVMGKPYYCGEVLFLRWTVAVTFSQQLCFIFM